MNKLDLVKITMVKELKERMMMLLMMKMSKACLVKDNIISDACCWPAGQIDNLLLK